MIYLLGAGTLTISDDLLGVIITACVTSIIWVICMPPRYIMERQSGQRRLLI